MAFTYDEQHVPVCELDDRFSFVLVFLIGSEQGLRDEVAGRRDVRFTVLACSRVLFHKSVARRSYNVRPRTFMCVFLRMIRARIGSRDLDHRASTRDLLFIELVSAYDTETFSGDGLGSDQLEPIELELL